MSMRCLLQKELCIALQAGAVNGKFSQKMSKEEDLSENILLFLSFLEAQRRDILALVHRILAFSLNHQPEGIS